MTYVALSTENFEMCGFTVLAVESSKAEAEAAAETRLIERHGCAVPGDFRSSTWHKNLRVVSKSEAMRRGWINRNTWGDVLDALRYEEESDRAERSL